MNIQNFVIEKCSTIPATGPFSKISDRALQFLAGAAKSGKLEFDVQGEASADRDRLLNFVRGIAPAVGMLSAMAMSSLTPHDANAQSAIIGTAPSITVQSGDTKVNIPKMMDMIQYLDASEKELGDIQFVADTVRDCTPHIPTWLSSSQITYALTHAALLGEIGKKDAADGRDVERVNARAVIMTVKEIIDWSHATNRSPVMAVAAYCAAPGVSGQWKDQMHKWDTTFSKLDGDQVAEVAKGVKRDKEANYKKMYLEQSQSNQDDAPKMMKVSGTNIFQWANAASNVTGAVLRAAGQQEGARLVQSAGSVATSAGSLAQQGKYINQSNGPSTLYQVGNLVQSADNVASQTGRAVQQYNKNTVIQGRVVSQGGGQEQGSDPYRVSDMIKQRSLQPPPGSNEVVIDGLRYTRQGI